MTASFGAQETTGKGGNRPPAGPASQLIDIHGVAEVFA
jgi:hypothetical protein